MPNQTSSVSNCHLVFRDFSLQSWPQSRSHHVFDQHVHSFLLYVMDHCSLTCSLLSDHWHRKGQTCCRGPLHISSDTILHIFCSGVSLLPASPALSQLWSVMPPRVDEVHVLQLCLVSVSYLRLGAEYQRSRELRHEASSFSSLRERDRLQ